MKVSISPNHIHPISQKYIYWVLKVIALMGMVLGYGPFSVGQVPPSWENFIAATEQGEQPILPDYSYSGYHFSERPLPDISSYEPFYVTDYGAIPDDTFYDDEAIQATINAAIASGKPALVLFSRGRYLVSSDDDLTKHISIHGDHIVLKGEGSDGAGTEIFMDNMRVKNGHWQFRFQPTEYNTGSLTTMVGSAKRGDFSIEVASAVNLSVGQSIFISHQSEEFARSHYGTLELNTSEWTRLFGTDGGLTLYECHIIEKIEGNTVVFENPIQVDLEEVSEPYAIRNLKTIEGVGIEDIRFTSNWGNYPEQFVHHANDTVDYAWNAVQFKFVKNAWIKNCEFKDWNQVADFRESIGITVQNTKITGKQGHASWITRRNYGVLVKDCEDHANQFHGPGVGYSGVSTVYLRYKMNEGQSIDCHSGSPFVTLMDDVLGGDFHTNGGPWVSYPHHGRHLTLWNFQHRARSDASYNFWSVAVRKPATYAEPFFVGLQSNNEVSIQGAGLDEMRGRAVEPKSLFEAQLALRTKGTTSTTLPLSKKDKLQFTVKPNPFLDGFLLNINGQEQIKEMKIFTLEGRAIPFHTHQVPNGLQVELDEKMKSGYYYLHIQTAKQSMILRLAKY